jgi:Transposase
MLQSYLSQVPDHRRREGRRYELAPIVLFSIFAILCGATSYRRIQRFITAHLSRFNQLLSLSWKRAPAHTSIRSILKSIEAEALEKVFREYSAELVSGKQSSLCIGIDGKTLRRSFDHFEDQKAVPMLSAFLSEEQILVGHIQVSDKSNEIPAVQQLIKELNLEQCVFTLDAMHCQKKRLKPQRQAIMK